MLLLDEPTNHLDIDAIGWLEDFLRRWPATLHVRHARPRVSPQAGRRAFWRSIAAGCSTGRATTRRFSFARKRPWRPRKSKTRCSTRSWPRRRSGFARASRPAARATKAACGRSKQMRLERSKRRDKTGTAKLEIQSGAAERRPGGQRREHLVRLRRPADRPRLLDHDHARRQDRHHRPQRRRQDDAVAAAARPASRRSRAPFAWAPICKSPTSTSSASSSTKRRPCRTTSAPAAKRSRSTAARGTCSATCRIFCSRPSGRARRCASSPAANATACCWRRLFSKPANVLVLDEPTNDLDTETLELLEERLVEFAGTLLLVSHDRAFLNNVVTSTIVFEAGGVREYVGGYDDWLRQRSEPAAAGSEREAPLANAKPSAATEGASTGQRRRHLQRKARARIAAGHDRNARRGDRRTARGNGPARVLPAAVARRSPTRRRN